MGARRIWLPVRSPALVTWMQTYYVSKDHPTSCGTIVSDVIAVCSFPIFLTSCHLLQGFSMLAPVMALPANARLHRATLATQGRGIAAVGVFKVLPDVEGGMWSQLGGAAQKVGGWRETSVRGPIAAEQQLSGTVPWFAETHYCRPTPYWVAGQRTCPHDGDSWPAHRT